MKLTLTGYSTALFSTWFFVEELGLLLDAGDGVAAGLLQKGGRVKNIFITHPDRDHLTGLFQFNQLNAREGFPIIHYPADCGSFPALKNFTSKFDEQVSRTQWVPIVMNSKTDIGKDLYVEAIRNNHVRAEENITKSLSYKVFKTKQKLKKEFAGLPGNEIRDLITIKGQGAVTNSIHENVINYSGDTPVDDYERWNNSNILIHEATFFGGDVDRKINPHGNKHSTLKEVMEMVANINVNQLILSHFSPRYSKSEIDKEIKRLIKVYNIKIPVYRMLPGEIHRDILSTASLNT